MKRILLLFIIVLCFGCEYFQKKSVNTEDLLKEELKSFNWNEVDEYPTFQSCDNALDRKVCFENTLREKLNKSLAEHLIVVSEELHDTILIKLMITKKGKLEVGTIKISEETKRIIPKMDSLMRHSLDSLPEIYPAIKRSQQVSTQFVLPVLVKVE